MNQKNKYLAIGAGVAAVAVIGWIALSHVATGRAEESIHAFLDKHELRHDVQWKNLSASPSGTVKIKDVSVRLPGDGLLNVDRIELTDFIDSADRKRASIKVDGVTDVQGRSPLGDHDYLRSGGIAQLPPLSFQTKWDLQLKDDKGALELSFNQPDALQGGLKLELHNIASLARLADGADQGQPSGNPFASSMMGPLGMLEALGSVELRSVSANVKDEGHVARSIALHKRYSYDITPDDNNPGRSRDAAFKADVKANHAICERQASTTYRTVATAKDSCKAVLDFLSGESSRLSVKAQPARPIALADLFQAAWRDPEDAIVRMNPAFD